eukprot:1266228-Rhodomonas_salina.3
MLVTFEGVLEQPRGQVVTWLCTVGMSGVSESLVRMQMMLPVDDEMHDHCVEQEEMLGEVPSGPDVVVEVACVECALHHSRIHTQHSCEGDKEKSQTVMIE